MEENKKFNEMKSGVVTLLDILGWKGIWQRKSDAIGSLLKLINLSKERISVVKNNEDENPFVAKFQDLEVKVKSISDTIAIVTHSSNINLSIEFHSILASIILPMSINEGIPVRGAISYGDFSSVDNIMVGPAIDEVAAWYELANWIGVILTPSARFQIKTDEFIFGEGFLIKYDNVPIKSYGKMELYSVNWPNTWIFREDKHLCRDKLLKSFLKSTPILPDIYVKFKNTLDFYDFAMRNEEKDTTSQKQIAAVEES